MRRSPAAGLLLACLALTACAGPLSQREAQNYAATSLRRYCAQTLPCGPLRIVQARRMGGRWLVDFESPTVKYGVLVHDTGATQVSAWKKPS